MTEHLPGDRVEACDRRIVRCLPEGGDEGATSEAYSLQDSQYGRIWAEVSMIAADIVVPEVGR